MHADLTTPTSKPVAGSSFADLGVPEPLVAVATAQGLLEPTPIQRAALPDALAGRDVLGSAPTGTGKTLAFGLAVLARVSASARAKHPRALILAPTRELAMQIADALDAFARAERRSVAVFYGGVGYGRQLQQLRRGVDVVVATPGRLADLRERGDVDLSHVEVVVVDEADRMADMGFLPEVRRLVQATSSERQTMLFSATFEGPVETLVRELCHDPVRHVVTRPDDEQGEVGHHFWNVDPSERLQVTAAAVRAAGPAVVFCRTRRGADRIAERLRGEGLATAAIHGDLNQRQRERALEGFRAGRIDALVATDVAARGIHVDDVPLVIHFDPPERTTDYVHRSGRTGRAGRRGSVVSLVGPRERSFVRSLQRELGLPHGLGAPDAALLPGSGRVEHVGGRRPAVGREVEESRAASEGRGVPRQRDPRARRGSIGSRQGGAVRSDARSARADAPRGGAASPRRPRRPER
ncbi:DEAD/DEAH box helicase domain protein [Acidimicrobium ferrooxidans DSM 10331]|uniref:DEAD/DEAH box helicase domain protein n=1 Tax=Acidimicrobium ferrooxidans (strain DSM 10331 / JCM 15462 / NBRC 103882 / ICP) TaxID=525909 RepID=C7M2L1_ACIFD|nr:DEAD/DEAH box helicase [Acidimicrobium ferrooxidans]ACU53255.1 DEAD/DEAH box helicase domain protein [Acidimicrobium ferrooxidans DSM 10331]